MMKRMTKIKDKYDALSIVSKATVWFMFSNILQRCISLLTTPFFTRVMSTEQYGLISTFNSWKQVLAIICTFCLDYGVFFKGLSKFKEDPYGYTVSMQTFSSIVTAIVTVVYLVFQNQINAFTELSTYLTLVMIFEEFTTFSISYWSIRNRNEYKYVGVVAITLSMSVLNVLLSFIAVLVSEQKDVARITAGAIVQIVFGLAIYFVNLYKGKKLCVWKYVKYAVAFNLPLLPHYFSTYILEQSDRIMIQKLIGLSAAGIYSVAYNAGAVIKIVGNSINNALVPWEYKKLEEKDYHALNKTFNQFMLIFVLAAILFITIAPEVIYLLAGSKYAEAVYCIPPVTSSCFFIFVWGVYGNAEFYYDANKFTMYISIVGAVLNLILNYICINLFGYIAAAYTTLACYMFFTLAHFFFVRYVSKKKVGVDVFEAKSLLIYSIILVAVSFLMTLLYQTTIPRYIVLVVGAILVLLKRDVLMSTINFNKQK